jgi:HSP20 family protein
MFETRLWENFADLDRTFAAIDAIRRGFVEEQQRSREAARFSAEDTGEAYVCKAELPGVPASALEVTLIGQVLKLKATRNIEQPKGFVVHRRERPAFELSRSVTLPAKVDAEKVTAVAKDGVVTVTLPKAAESKPRTINVTVA